MRTGIFIFTILLWACNGRGNQESKTDSAGTNMENHITRDSLMTPATDFTLEITQLKNSVLYGREIKVVYKQLYTDDNVMKKVLPDIINQIALQKKVITGPLQLIVLEIPEENDEMRIFIGIPINNADGLSPNSSRKIPSGKYIKAVGMSEPGSGAGLHRKILAELRVRNIKTGLPIIEIYSETKNESEVSSLGRATFLYPIQ